MSNSQDAFTDVKDETTEEKILRVCEVIISCGIGIRGGQITNGGNMVAVEGAIKSMSRDDIKFLDGLNPIVPEIMGCNMGFSTIIGLYAAHLSVPDRGDFLKPVVAAASTLKKLGWQTDAKPVNYDLNAAGARLAGYVQPEGFAKEFVDAFDIGYKSPSTPQPKTPTGAK